MDDITEKIFTIKCECCGYEENIKFNVPEETNIKINKYVCPKCNYENVL